jgi:phage tail sheath protein FI
MFQAVDLGGDVQPLGLTGGDDGEDATTGDYINQLNAFFGDFNQRPVTIFMDGGKSDPAYQAELLATCQQRKDSVAILSVPIARENSANYLQEIVNYKTQTLNSVSSFGAIYAPHPQIYDKFNDRNIFVPPDGYVASVISFGANTQQVYFPPAGWQRGVINVRDLNRRFTEGEMDFLYDNNVNPIRFQEGRGIAVWGQKTLQTRPSALDRMNVRLLLIVIEPAIRTALDDFVFEYNDAETRGLIEDLLNDYLQGIQADRGLLDYRVVCSEVNNSGQDIDNNRLNVWVFLKPNKAAEFIPTKIVITRTDFDFSLAEELL